MEGATYGLVNRVACLFLWECVGAAGCLGLGFFFKKNLIHVLFTRRHQRQIHCVRLNFLVFMIFTNIFLHVFQQSQQGITMCVLAHIEKS